MSYSRRAQIAVGLCAALSVLLTAVAEAADTATLSGSVTIAAPIVSKKRVSRRSRYRNRRATRQGRAGAKMRSPYADVVVSVRPLSFQVEAARTVARLNQVDATFMPRVLPITVGSEVEFVNQDKVYHNVFSLAPRFNIGRKARGDVVSLTIDATGKIDVFCDIHPQMNATILSLDTPYYTHVDSLGGYAIESLPQGSYEVQVFHPELETIVERIDLGDGEQLVRDFALSE